MKRFQGKRVLITGATSGIGLAGALRIAAEGGEVIASGRDEARLEHLRQALPDHCRVLYNDAASEDCGRQLREALGAAPLDGLWLNAGRAEIGALHTLDAAAFDALMLPNLRGPVLQMASLAEQLAPGASVVLSGSTSAYEGAALASLYSAAKAALLGLSRCWASALGGRGIRVNTLVPGPIDTAFRDFMPADTRREFEASVLAQLALPRMGRAEEAAAVALFLLSDESSFVTASQYAVDGGLTMH